MAFTDVLVVEDDAPTRILLLTILARLGLTVRTTQNGAEALRALREEAFGAVLVDLFLPRVSGEELLEILARTDPRMLRRVIVLSAASGSTVDAIAARYPIRAAMRKPVDISDLAAEVLDLLTEGAMQRAALRRLPVSGSGPAGPPPGAGRGGRSSAQSARGN